MPQAVSGTSALRRHDTSAKTFASDNYAGAHPEILAALAAANGGHQPAYGDDVYTLALQDVIRRRFGPQAEAFPVFNGTGANVVALQAATDRWGGVICAQTAHIHADECGAPEHIGGLKLYPVPTADGKLTPALIEREAFGWDDMHRATPQVVSISQATELGTIYTPEEIREICDYAHERGMQVHVDGAQLANAAATLEVSLGELVHAPGVDLLSFGGTKSGALFGEVLVVLNPAAVRRVRHILKSSAQLIAKMRFVSVQLEALLADDLWLRNAHHANSMAQRLAAGIRNIEGLDIVHPVQANGVFVSIPVHVGRRLQKRYRFYFRDEQPGVVRWMCSYDTSPTDVDRFLAAISEEMRQG